MPASCTFCAIVGGDREGHVVASTDEVLAFLDARPVFKGHTLVVPRQHVETLADLPDELLVPVFSVVRDLCAVMPGALDMHGTWVAINNVVSQSVPHLHVHVVPRRRKDGLRGFFWPRQRYDDEAEMAATAARLRQALEHV